MKRDIKIIFMLMLSVLGVLIALAVYVELQNL